MPGLERDMIAYTAKQVRKINKAVDFVNVSFLMEILARPSTL